MRTGVILLLALAVTVVHGDDVLSNVCSSMQDLCSRSFKFPASASVETRRSCTDNACTWPCTQVISGPYCTGCSAEKCGQACTNNCCKWRCGNRFGIPCFGCSESRCGQSCTNKCCNWDCEKPVETVCAGVSKQHCEESCIDIPDTLRIKYEDISTCDAAQAASSVPMDKLVDLCPCLGKVGDYVSKVGDDPSGAKTEVLTTAAELTNCLVTAGLSVLENSAAVRANLLANSATERVIDAPVIGSSFYISLSGAIAGCALSGTTCEQIPDLFLRHFKDAAGSVGKELAAYLKSVLVDGVFNAVLSPVKSLQSTAREWPELVMRQVTDCTSAPAKALESKAQELQGAVNALKKFVDDSQALLQLHRMLVDSAAR